MNMFKDIKKVLFHKIKIIMFLCKNNKIKVDYYYFIITHILLLNVNRLDWTGLDMIFHFFLIIIIKNSLLLVHWLLIVNIHLLQKTFGHEMKFNQFCIFFNVLLQYMILLWVLFFLCVFIMYFIAFIIYTSYFVML